MAEPENLCQGLLGRLPQGAGPFPPMMINPHEALEVPPGRVRQGSPMEIEIAARSRSAGTQPAADPVAVGTLMSPAALDRPTCSLLNKTDTSMFAALQDLR